MSADESFTLDEATEFVCLVPLNEGDASRVDHLVAPSYFDSPRDIDLDCRDDYGPFDILNSGPVHDRLNLYSDFLAGE